MSSRQTHTVIRDERTYIRVSAEEKQRLSELASRSDCSTISEYVRNVSLGYPVKPRVLRHGSQKRLSSCCGLNIVDATISEGGASMAIKGLDNFTRRITELQRATKALDGDIASVNFDPHDPQSIELAIQKMEAAVDEKVGDYRDNEMVAGVVSDIKDQYRQAILERAAEARIEGETDI